MEQNTQSQSLTLVDIIKMFKGKFVKLICITLAAAILCGGIIILKTAFFGEYGAEVTFYLSYADGSYELLTLLQSESFAEKLLLDENGLPPKSECDPADYEAALAAINAFNDARQQKHDVYEILNMIPYSLAIIQDTYNNLVADYNEIYNLLNIYKSAQSDKIADNDNHAKKIAEYEEKLAVASAAKDEYEKSTYNPAIKNKLELEEKAAKASELVKNTRKESEELTEKLVSKWRKNKEVSKEIQKVSQSVKFEFATREVNNGNATVDVDNSIFLIISVATSEGEEFAEKVVESIKTITPGFMEKNIERLTGATEPYCTLISTLSTSHNLDAKDMIKNAIVFAVLGGAIACVVFCGIVIMKNTVLAAVKSPEKSEMPTDEPEDIYAEK